MLLLLTDSESTKVTYRRRSLSLDSTLFTAIALARDIATPYVSSGKEPVVLVIEILRELNGISVERKVGGKGSCWTENIRLFSTWIGSLD